MDINKTRTEFLQYRHVYRSIVYEGPAAPAGRQFTAYYALGIIVKTVLLKESLEAEIRDTKDALDDTTVGTFTNGLCIGTLTKEHGHSAKEHRFSVSCLTGDDREARRKIDLDLLDKREITYGNMLQHYLLNYCSSLSSPTAMTARG